MLRESNLELVDVKRFLEATRESGYRNLDASLSELIDNSLQADARNIHIWIERTPSNPSEVEVVVLDDGTGMSADELAVALQFGGSHRFNNREGLGRFGMGLPNSSLAQARRAEVYTWQRRGQVWSSHLDVDELLAADPVEIPLPVRSPLPPRWKALTGSHGTLVWWKKVDRVRATHLASILRRLQLRLGRRFRHFLWEGRRIFCNDEPLLAFDPLFLASEMGNPIRASQYGPDLTFEFQVPTASAHARKSSVRVRFSELPIPQLAHLSNDDKRLLGVVGGAGVSIVRAGREIDYGWFFFSKRRENYDDWWRCEIAFEPELDELFGVTHTKQGIRPNEELKAALTQGLSGIARTLHRRVQNAHLEEGQKRAQEVASRHASIRDVYLRPLAEPASEDRAVLSSEGTPATLEGDVEAPQAELRLSLQIPRLQAYQLSVGEVPTRAFYHLQNGEGEVHFVLNRHHEFYRQLYAPLLNGTGEMLPFLGQHLELCLFALGRSQLLPWSDAEREVIARFIDEWSRAIEVFCSSSPSKK